MEVRRGRQTPRNQESFYRLPLQQLKTPSPSQVFKAAPLWRPCQVTWGLDLQWPPAPAPILSPPIANIWATITGKQTKEVAWVRRQDKHSLLQPPAESQSQTSYWFAGEGISEWLLISAQ